MSQDVERVYTVNLGKVLLSPDNQRAKRAVNMIKEFARHHMKTQQVKIEEDVSHLLWSRGIKHPPRKIRVRMTKTDEGYVLVSKYEAEEGSGGSEPTVEPDAKSTSNQNQLLNQNQMLNQQLNQNQLLNQIKYLKNPNQSLKIKNFILIVLNQVHS